MDTDCAWWFIVSLLYLSFPFLFLPFTYSQLSLTSTILCLSLLYDMMNAAILLSPSLQLVFDPVQLIYIYHLSSTIKTSLEKGCTWTEWISFDGVWAYFRICDLDTFILLMEHNRAIFKFVPASTWVFFSISEFIQC